MSKPSGLVTVKGITYVKDAVIEFPIGAAALVYGQLCKVSGGLMVTAADNDQQGVFYVCLGNYAASASTGSFVPLFQVGSLEITYTGSAPTIGVSYGISDGVTLDQANVTQLLLTVISVDSTKTTCKAHGYYKSS